MEKFSEKEKLLMTEALDSFRKMTLLDHFTKHKIIEAKTWNEVNEIVETCKKIKQNIEDE